VKVLYALAAAALVVLAAPAPAQAHGALTNPVSRLAACGTEGTSAGTAACEAALAASGRQQWADWDNLRLPDVAGRDREVIPDGIGRYAGLDLPRADWPTTRLTAGASFAFAYAGTIRHAGTFKLYVTRDGYDPKAPLAWSDLEAKPFLTAEDPAFRDRAYRMKGTLPAAKSGRHLIYTIWRNSSTPDTYYSCSDVIFSTPVAKPAKATKPAPKPAVASASEAPPPEETPSEEPVIVVQPEPVANSKSLPLIGGGAAVIVILGALFGVFLIRKRS